MQLVFASNNKNKIKEIQILLPPMFQLLSLEDIGCLEEIPETADTIEGNAILKANYVTQNYGYNCFADDTGLEVEALNNAPGVYSARYAGPGRNAADNMHKLLEELKSKDNRKARFRTVICLMIRGEEYIFEGIVEGTISAIPRGEGGFGYDPVFIPEGESRTFAQMSLEEKNNMSHRGKAIAALKKFLEQSGY
jgi:XTP/dITP diphosphohydrolase